MENPLVQWRQRLSDQREQARHGLLSGRRMREEARNRERRTIEQKALAAVMRYLPGLFKDPVDTSQFESDWPLVISKLSQIYRDKAGFDIGFRTILEYLHKGNSSGLWRLPLASIPLTIERMAIPYNECWFGKTKQCSVAEQNWYTQITERSGIQLSATELLVDILHSAVFHSGVHNLAVLHELMLAVARRERLYSNGYYVWIPLDIAECALATNDYAATNELVTHIKVFLTLPTLGLVYRWYRRLDDSEPVPQRRDVFSSWASQRLVAPMRSITSFCHGATLIASLRPGVQWPQVLTHVATGGLQSAALPHGQWLALHHPMIAYDEQKPLQQAPTADVAVGDAHPRRYHGRDKPYSPLLARLRVILAEKKSATEKKSVAASVNELTALLEDHTWSESEHILVGWLLDAIKHKKHKLSTARAYLSRGGQQWLALCFGHDIRMWDGERFLCGYRAVLESYHDGVTIQIAQDPWPDESVIANSASTDQANTRRHANERQVSYVAARLASLHRYAVAMYNLEPLPEDLMSRVKRRSHVRSNFISEPVFHELLGRLDRSNTWSDDYRERLIALYILAYRSGLRLSEVQKLRLMDIERSETMWIYVRDTRLDEGKSDSATRKIALGVLLTEHERLRLDAYLAPLWVRMKKNAQALAFPSPDGSLIPLLDKEISAPLTSILKQISGQRHTFHHLRHTALSRLQLVLHHRVLGLHDLPGWKHFMPWTAEMCDVIDRTMMQCSPQGKYWALAQIAGHLSPDTTLHNYLHFSDWVSAACLLQARYELPMSLRWYFSGQSRAALKKHGWQDGEFCWERCKDVILDSVSAWTTEVSWQPIVMAPLPIPRKRKFDFAATLELITLVSKREDLNGMFARYDLTQEYVNEMVHRARLLRAIRTQRERWRLIRSKYPTQALLPGPLRSHRENAELVKVVDKARQVYKTQRV